MPLDVLYALRDGPRSRDAMLAGLDADDRLCAERALHAALASGEVVAQHLQTLPPRTLYRLASRAGRVTD